MFLFCIICVEPNFIRVILPKRVSNKLVVQETVELLMLKSRAGGTGGAGEAEREDAAPLCWRCRRHFPPAPRAPACPHCRHEPAHALPSHGTHAAFTELKGLLTALKRLRRCSEEERHAETFMKFVYVPILGMHLPIAQVVPKPPFWWNEGEAFAFGGGTYYRLDEKKMFCFVCAAKNYVT